jgi:hypothetical protein
MSFQHIHHEKETTPGYSFQAPVKQHPDGTKSPHYSSFYVS